MKTRTPDHRSAVASALAALDVLSQRSFSWMGEPFDLPAAVVRLAGDDQLRRVLIDAMRWRLYSCFFTRGRPMPPPPKRSRAVAWRPLSPELAAANLGTGCLDPGWRLVGQDDGRHIVERSGLRLWVSPNEIAAIDQGAPRFGDIVAIRLPPDAPEYSPGFYLALGDHGFSAGTPRVFDRFYLNLRREGAVDFVRETTRRINRAGLAFRAKVADEPEGFERCDSAIIIFERRDRECGLAVGRALRAALARFVDDETPALTRPIAPGLAFAEDPGPDESFGAHRCHLLAEAAVIAHEKGLRDLDERLEVAQDRFAGAGISIDAPYLGPGSIGDLDDSGDRIHPGAVA